MRAALFDLDETILDRSGSLREFATWQATGMLRSIINDKALFIERFIELDQKGMVWKDEVYKSLVEEFSITEWSVDELLNVYLLTFCAFCKPRNGAVAAIEKFRDNGFKIGLVSNGKTPFQERNFQALGISELFDCIVVSEAVGLRKPTEIDRMDDKLSVKKAYVAMYKYLEEYYDITKSHDVDSMLGDMSLLQDGQPADNAVTNKWLRAIDEPNVITIFRNN